MQLALVGLPRIDKEEIEALKDILRLILVTHLKS